MALPLLAVALAVAGQTAANPPSSMVLSLKQLTMAAPTGQDEAARTAAIDRFRTATRAIDSCAGADRLAAEMGATVTDNDAVALAELPEPLRTAMATLPEGHASPVYGVNGGGRRVLVLCGRR